MKTLLVSSLVAALLLNGCATTYQGQGPDFSLKGNEASREIEKFTIEPSFFQHGTRVYEMGPERTDYWTSSIAPMMTEVSPASAKLINRARWWEVVDWIFLAAATGILIGASGSSSTAWQTPFYASLALSVGSGIYSNIIVGEAAEQYNRDLRQKFSPQVSFSIPY